MLPFAKFSNNIRKTIRYARKNGVREAFYAASERLFDNLRNHYVYEEPSAETLSVQRTDYRRLAGGEEPEEVFRSRCRMNYPPKISILVPACDPASGYFRELAESVLSQTYGNLELVVADAGRTDTVRRVLDGFDDPRIVYRRLPKNEGISANTNAAAELASGEYVGFLDHDDLLTPDALYEMAYAAMRENAELLYSDEDKCDAAGKAFFEPNRKPDFNQDYLFSNNYICHFLMIKRELFLALKLRPSYDGAQDYDLVLRAPKSSVVHVPKVLYHWRTHNASTAANPASKQYAYDAGKRALEDYFRTHGMDVAVSHSRHLGFYRTQYHPDIFTVRTDVGAVGGKIVNAARRICGGMMDETGRVTFEGRHEMTSGPMHRADTAQDADFVDARCMRIRDELKPLYRDVFGVPYGEELKDRAEILKGKSLEFCRRVRQMGYVIVWDPEMTCRSEDR